MSFRASNKEFDQIFVKKNMTGLFMKKLRIYLERHKDMFPYDELLKCIDNNISLAVFACREDIADEMYASLLGRLVPCLRIATANGRTGFIISEEMIDKVVPAQDEVLKEKTASTRTNVLTGQQLLEGHLNPDKRDIAVISGLSREEAYRLMDLSHEKLLLNSCAIDEMTDGTYSFNLYQEDSLKSHHKVTLAQIYLQMKMELLGPYREEIIDKTERRHEMNQLIGADFDIKSYNHGSKVGILGDKNTYMIIEEKQFEFGYIKEVDGEKKYVAKIKEDKGRADYHDRLRSCAMRISHPVILRDEKSIDQIEFRDLSKSNQEIRYEIAIGNVLKNVGEMLIERSREDPDIFMHGEITDILKNTVKESSRILLSAAGGICPYEYTTEQINSFRKIVADNHLNLEPFRETFESMSEISIHGKGRPIDRQAPEQVSVYYEPDIKDNEEIIDEQRDLWMEWSGRSL